MRQQLNTIYVALLLGILILSLAAREVPASNATILGGGAFVCFMVIIAAFLFERIYEAVDKVGRKK